MQCSLESLFGLKEKTAVVTGGTGVLCGAMARALGALGVRVAVLGRRTEVADAVAKKIRDGGGEAAGVHCDVTQRDSVLQAREEVEKALGPVDYLINGAGGNSKQATSACVTVADQLDPTFFDLEGDGVDFVFNLNFLGTLLPSQVFGKPMVERKQGAIVNISSMSGILPLTKVMAYSAAKAAIENFTRWLAVHFAPADVRVNAIAPGFFLTDQNRFLLTDEATGELTDRGRTIVDATPMKRFGDPDELLGALVYLLSDASRFVTGTTLAVDGGFSAFGGV